MENLKKIGCWRNDGELCLEAVTTRRFSLAERLKQYEKGANGLAEKLSLLLFLMEPADCLVCCEGDGRHLSHPARDLICGGPTLRPFLSSHPPVPLTPIPHIISSFL